MIFIVAMMLLIVGLVLCGPVHHALHAQHGFASGDLHGGDGGDSCDSCSVSSLESPAAFCVSRIVLRTSERFDPVPLRAPSAQAPLFHSPRGPPAHA